MAKSYRAIRQWDHWISQLLGSELLEAEGSFLSKLLTKFYGKHAVLIGVPAQYSLLQSSEVSSHLLITPLNHQQKDAQCIEGDWNELPILSGSVDLVILPHALEHVDNPHQVLSEACRIVKPEGCIVILGFNPYSFWGLQALFDRMRSGGTSVGFGNFVPVSKVKKWLTLADFELSEQKTLLFRPPLAYRAIFQKLRLFEWIGEKMCLPFGGVYMLKAKAKVIPLTPIRMHWKQQLAGIQIIPRPRPTVRNF